MPAGDDKGIISPGEQADRSDGPGGQPQERDRLAALAGVMVGDDGDGAALGEDSPESIGGAVDGDELAAAASPDATAKSVEGGVVVRAIDHAGGEPVIAEEDRQQIERAVVGGDQDHGTALPAGHVEQRPVAVGDPPTITMERAGVQQAVSQHEVGEVPDTMDETSLGDAVYIGSRNSAGQSGPTLSLARMAKGVEQAVEQPGRAGHQDICGPRTDDTQDGGEQATVDVQNAHKETEHQRHAAGSHGRRFKWGCGCGGWRV